jgi:acyl carrier protein
MRKAIAVSALALMVPAALLLSGCSDKPRAEAESAASKAVKKIVAQHIGQATGSISASTNLCDGLEIDSLDFIEIIMALEEEFKLTISDDEAMQMRTVGDMISYVEKAKS